MILKFLLVVGVVTFIYFMFIKKKPALTKQNKNADSKDEVQSNDMVECAECGIYCEIDDTIISNNKYYCSKECVEKS
jgi:uncharacterized protein